jgi:hypothetical protein
MNPNMEVFKNDDPNAPLPKPAKKVKIDKVDKLRRKRVLLVQELSELDNLIDFLLNNPTAAKLLD